MDQPQGLDARGGQGRAPPLGQSKRSSVTQPQSGGGATGPEGMRESLDELLLSARGQTSGGAGGREAQGALHSSGRGDLSASSSVHSQKLYSRGRPTCRSSVKHLAGHNSSPNDVAPIL